MICIVAVEDSSPLMLLQSARTMFKAYGEFVRNSGNHPGFRFDRLDQEILELPDAYSTRNGEVLLAMRLSEVVGCIAYRAVATPANPRTCEIKRLFVLPEQRGHGIGSSLVSTCIDRARARGHQLACLDTEPETMAAAHHTYLRLGFVEYKRHYSATEGPVAFLKRPLCELAESGFSQDR
jgi:GNAT superfamily N-acetyltransferase